MNRTQRLAYGTLFTVVSVLIALLLSIVAPAFDSTTYAQDNSAATITANVNLPMLSEDRYAPADNTTIITIITDQLVPLFLPNTSGEGVCGVDVVCDNTGAVVD